MSAEAAIGPGKTGVYMHDDGPLNKQIPVWFHCSDYFVFGGAVLSRLYERPLPPAPAPVLVHPSEEFPVLGTPYMADNADSDDEGGVGPAELAFNGGGAEPVPVKLEPAEEEAQKRAELQLRMPELGDIMGGMDVAESVLKTVGREKVLMSFAAGSGGDVSLNAYVLHLRELAKGVQRTHSHVVILMHGCLRNAAQYLDAWKPIADRCGLLVLCPQFSAADFPDFATGNVFDRTTGRAVPKEQWLFSVVERIFDGVRAMGVERTHYYLYGHSDGAQFVHRMLMFLPEARVHTAVAANSDWYTFPSHDVPYPYGLDCSGVSRSALREILSKRMVILLGHENCSTLHLRRTRRALAQGGTRFDRGIAFFLKAKGMSHDLGLPMQWSVRTVAGVGHVHEEMSHAAVASFGFVTHPGLGKP